ncbi:unnamed protein product [Rotaria sordida]|uniref:Uncharacterized protein n=1 Tax=Rotaria sordida TaxID=392033 RepID=A0A814PF35_9BILA|nr:unnamed protein product [Rotaria sordida]
MFTNEQQLQASLTKKLADNQAIDRSIFSKRYALSSNVANAELSDDGNSKEMQLPELSHFIIQSLTSILIILIKSAEKNDPTIVHQILTLTSQLCEQIPAKCLSTGDNLLSASLKPLTDYIYDLSFSKDSTVAKKAIKIRLGFSISQASFKHILPLLTNLIFITDDVYDVQGLFIRWNDDLTVALDDWEKQQSTDSTETDEDDTQPEPEPEPESDSESKSKSDHDVEQEKDKDTTLNQTAAASVRLTGTNETPFGIYETIAGGNSSSSTSGYGTGNYPSNENPSNVFDDYVSTKYLNFGNCGSHDAGLRTGLYFILKRGPSIVTGLRFYTANDCPDRDPLTVTLEGSNEPGELLHLGSSWNLIYKGPSGLENDPDRQSRGVKQSFSNSTPYASYRLLITEKRDYGDAVQYSKFQLYGYQQRASNEICLSSLDYLKSIEAFPNEQLINLDDRHFSGQFISSIILAHIDIDNEFNSKKQFQSGSLDGSMSFEFHPDTFKQLFRIIEQLAATITQDSSTAVIHMLTVCLRLFTTHLKFLCAVKSTLDKDLFGTNDELRKTIQTSSTESNTNIDLSKFATPDDLEKWFEVLLKLACGDNDEKSDYKAIRVIIEIETNTDDLDDTSFPYLIQYSQTNETEWANADKLRIEVAVPPPTLLSLPNVINSNEDIHSLLDTLGYFIQIDTSTTESQPLLQIKRRSVAVLCEILNEKKIVEIFMQKPYASTIAKLSIPEKNRTPPSYLRLFNRQHLEQYCLSLDNCKRSKQIVEDSDTEKEIINDEVDDSFSIWNRIPIDCEQLIVEALTTNSMIYNGWKPYTSKEDIELYKQGRIGGSDELSIMPMPRSISDSSVFEESGNKHKFKGRITPTSGNTHVSFPTFIVDNIRLTEGNWYYCIKFRTAALAQVGWATTGFMPAGDSGRGVGDDKYSWSYDGSRGTLYHQTEYRNFTSDDIRWKDDDVCGCAIEIDGENTKIKYWLNGRFLGTAFEHQCNIGTTTTKCNLLPNGRGTTYFPAVSSQATYNAADYELIFSPEDMTECPLPKGYKPLMMPKLINIENSIVAYPYSAYLVGNNVQDYFTTVRRTTASTSVLRDFVNEQHLQATFTVEDHQLRLPENSDGFPFSLDNYSTSLTISFDFEIQTETENDILLCTLGTPEMFSVRIPLTDQTYQSKVFILHLFVTLIQTSKTFHLSEQIQNFLFQLFIELSSSETMTVSQPIMSSAGETYELVPGGSEIPITANNFQEYCTRYREYRLNEFSRQIEFIRQGLYSVVPGYYLNLFTASELEESVCGKGEIDIEILKRNTNYGGNLNENSPHIQRFWNVLSEMFNEEQKKQFLIFVWGRSTLPVQDEDFTMKFGISEYYLSSNEVDKALPRSHTCFFTIDLPEYSTTEIMYERLNYAIMNCSSIDGDGNMNEMPE